MTKSMVGSGSGCVEMSGMLMILRLRPRLQLRPQGLEWQTRSIVVGYVRCRNRLVLRRRWLLGESFRDGRRGVRCRGRGGRRVLGEFGRGDSLLRWMGGLRDGIGVHGGPRLRRRV